MAAAQKPAKARAAETQATGRGTEKSTSQERNECVLSWLVFIEETSAAGTSLPWEQPRERLAFKTGPAGAAS